MTDKTPYGDVSYADTGFQADGKKRYPIDTAEHVRAAWSYINVVSNARKYTASQLAQIKSRIATAAKKLGVDVHAEAAAEHARLRKVYESSAAKKRRKHAYVAPPRGWIGSPVCLTCGMPKNDPDHDGDMDGPGPDSDTPPVTQQGALKQQGHPAGYDAETQIIKVNKTHPNVAKRHAFRPSEMPTAQGASRCLMCGGPQPPSGFCNAGADQVMDVRPGPTVVPIAAADDTDAAKIAAGIDAGVDEALTLLRSCKNEDLVPYAQQARDLLQGLEPACDALLEYFGVSDPDDQSETAADYGQHSVIQLGDDWALVDGSGTVLGRYETEEEANHWLDAARKRLSLPDDPEFQEGEEPSDILAGDPKDEAPKPAPGLQNPWAPYIKTASALSGNYPISTTFTSNPVTTATTTTSLFKVNDIAVPRADEVRAYLQGAANVQMTAPLPRTKAFIAEINGKTILTTQASTELAGAMTNHEHYLWTSGRLVGADEPNRNGAFWSSGDLELGQTTVPYGPLNWLHEEKHVIGSIAAASYSQTNETSGLGAMPNHIAIAAPVWRWLYPDEAAVVEMASETGKFWYSMECISKEVGCVGASGCGAQVPYGDYIQGIGSTCQHMIERSGTRRFVDPVFLGAAVIVPPVRPGWAGADATVMHQAASLAEKAFEAAGRPDISAAEWELLMAEVVRSATA